MTHVSVNIKTPKVKIDTLVETSNGSLGIVTKLTRKWVHVFMLINKYEDEPNYHTVKFFKRGDLTERPVGSKIAFVNKE